MSTGSKFLDFFDLLSDKKSQQNHPDKKEFNEDNQELAKQVVEHHNAKVKAEIEAQEPQRKQVIQSFVDQFKNLPDDIKQDMRERVKKKETGEQVSKEQDYFYDDYFIDLVEDPDRLGDDVLYGELEKIEAQTNQNETEKALEQKSIRWLKNLIEDNPRHFHQLAQMDVNCKTIPTYEQYLNFFSKSFIEIEKIYSDRDRQNRDRLESAKANDRNYNNEYKPSTIVEDRLYKLKYGLRIHGLDSHLPTLDLYESLKSYKPNFEDYTRLTNNIIEYINRKVQRKTIESDGRHLQEFLQTKKATQKHRTRTQENLFIDDNHSLLFKRHIVKYMFEVGDVLAWQGYEEPIYITGENILPKHHRERNVDLYDFGLKPFSQGTFASKLFASLVTSYSHDIIPRIQAIGSHVPHNLWGCKSEVEKYLNKELSQWNRKKKQLTSTQELQQKIIEIESNYNVNSETVTSYSLHDTDYEKYVSQQCKDYSKFKEQYLKTNTLEPMKIRFPLLEKIRTQTKLILPRKEQETHSYIIGGTKSGKSELIKFLFVQDVLHGKRNTILLDPHGDVSSEIINIAFLHPKQAEKIIYIDTAIHKQIGEKCQKLPCINPLEINPNYIKTDEDIEAVADNLILAFQEIVKAENTVNMTALLKPCLCVLLREENTTLLDLARFMDDERNEDLVKLGQASPNFSHRDFFEHGFYSKSRATTKQALGTRLQVALNSSIFVKMTCGKTTVDFYEIMRGQGNTVIFRLDKNNTKAIQKELGILITSTIMSSAFSLEKHERVGTHLFMDEFQNFINRDIENILSECRKYKLYLTMAHQYMSQITDTALKQGILANTNIKMIGKIGGNAVPFLKNNGEHQIEQEHVDQLRTGKFLIRVASRGAGYNFVKVPSVLVHPKWIPIEQKKQFLFEQYKRYYEPSKMPAQKTTSKPEKDDLDFNNF